MESWTITQATDWPMFVFMVGVLGAVFMVLWAIVILLLRNYHNVVLRRIDERHEAVMLRISSERKADTNHCKECHESLGQKFQRIWKHLRIEEKSKDQEMEPAG